MRILNWGRRKSMWKCIEWYWGERDVKKKKGIVAKSLWQRAEKLLKIIWCLECHGSWLRLFPLLSPFAESCKISNFCSAQRWGHSRARWPLLTWGYAGPHGSEGYSATLEAAKVVLNTIINRHLYVLPTSAIGPGADKIGENIKFSCQSDLRMPSRKSSC